MKYLEQLLQAILALGYPANHCEAWVEQGSIDFASDNKIDGFVMNYTANFLLSNLKINHIQFFAQIVLWLAKHDPDRTALNLSAPQYFITPLSGDKLDLALRIDFYETIDMVADEQGDWEIDGLKYKAITDIALAPLNSELEEVANTTDGLNNG